MHCIMEQNFFLYSMQIVKEKDRFRKAPPNYAMKKTQLLKDKVTENNSVPPVQMR